jgi:hypothetical protein
MNGAQEDEAEGAGGEVETHDDAAAGSKRRAAALLRAQALVQGRKRTVAIYLTQRR